MKRNIYYPALDANVQALPIAKGGTAAVTQQQAVINLGLLTNALRDQPSGVVSLDGNGDIPSSVIPPSLLVESDNISGVASLVTGTAGTYTITDYDSAKTYTLAVVNGNGTVSRSGAVVTYTAGAAGAGGFIINGKTVSVTVTAITINQASITSPTTGATGLSGSVAFTGSAFGVTGGSDNHEGSDWQIATDAGFTNIVASVTNDATNKLSWTGTVPNPNTTYYARVRYKGVSYGYGAWSSTVSFTTKASFTPNTEQAKLTASDRAADDSFGWSVSISSDGSRVVVGAYRHSGGVFNAGAAYIFLRSGTSWTQEAKITASDRAASDGFGISVSISSDGSRVVVGAYNHSGGVSGAGAAYIFLRSGTSWTQEAKLVASDRAASDYFGWSVSISSEGSRVVVGAYNHSGGVSNAGAAYIFLRSGTSWTQEAKIVASDRVAGDRFGYSVSISSDGSRVVVGADLQDGGVTNAGAAYIFLRSGTSWTQEAKLLASDRAASDQFGYSVSISSDGSRVVVGARYQDPGGVSNAGAAYIFLRSGTSWTQEAKLVASDRAADDRFGYSVSISSDGSRVVVGADLQDGGVTDAGAAYIFLRTSTTWAQEAKITASDRAASDQFGISVSISSDGSRVVSGAWGANPGSVNDAGAAYIFS